MPGMLTILISVALLLLGGGVIYLLYARRSGHDSPAAANYAAAIRAYRDARRDLKEATETMRLATSSLVDERGMLERLNKEVVSSLMLASGQGTLLSPEDEHDLHVEAEVRRIRKEVSNG